MENKHIDKIAALVEPDHMEGSKSLGEGHAARGAELPEEQPVGSPASEPRSEAQPKTGWLGSDAGGPGVDDPRGVWSEFLERNRILEEDWKLRPVTSPEEYFSILFTRGGINYMQETGQSNWGDHHYNAVVYDLCPRYLTDKKTGKQVVKYRAKRYDITRTLQECVNLTSIPSDHRVISSPILYAGQSRKSEMARSIWGIAIDLDDVRPKNLADFAWWITGLDLRPMPSMIVSSGNGLHIYYLFPMGVGTHSGIKKALQRLKHNITMLMWNGLFSSDPNPDLHQGIWQGFRIPGTPTKRAGYQVIGFVPEEIPYYTARELNDWFQAPTEGTIDRDSRPLTEEELKAVEANRYIPSPISFQEAKERWPDWDPDKPHGQWVANRRLYDWWLRLIRSKDKALTVGRRYYWILALVAFAKKCQIPFDELQEDAYSLVDMMESMTETDDNHFTATDVDDALRSYHYTGERSLARYKKNYIGAKTGYYFRHNKRNGRTRSENLIIARMARDVDMKSSGMRWDDNNGRKEEKYRVLTWNGRNRYNCNKQDCARELGIDAHTVAKWWWKECPQTPQEAVLKWRTDHPDDDNKSLCARECGLSRTTVIKWWNCTPEDAEVARSGQKARQRRISAAAAAKMKTAKLVDGYASIKEEKEHILQDSADIMYDHAVASIDAEPQPGDKEKLDELFKTMMSMLPPGINKEDFLKQMMQAMPEYFEKIKKEEK